MFIKYFSTQEGLRYFDKGSDLFAYLILPLRLFYHELEKFFLGRISHNKFIREYYFLTLPCIYRKYYD